MGKPITRFYSRCLFAIIAGCLLPAIVAMACETPVYRYAMYRWQPAPYEVYFFHDQPISDQDQRVQDSLIEFERGGDSRANVAYIPVDISEDAELASVPPDVKKAWLEREEKQLPSYFVSTPYGVGLSFEQLDEAKVEALIESPARKSLAAQLETGKLGVFVMLTGKEKAETDATEKLLNELVAEVQAGKVSLYVSPAEGPVNPDAPVTEPNFDLGFIKIQRESTEEQWFVRSLLAMEPDLTSEERPMVFLVYGRARALLPYIGKGITRENLIREIEFISGACSCTVKEQNPGVDLLVKYDWESASAAVAEKFGSEEGNESQFGPEMFFPELIIPESNAPPTTPVTAADSDEPITDNTIIEEPVVEATATGDVEKGSDIVEVSASETLVDPELTASPTGPEVATVAPNSATTQSMNEANPPASTGMGSVWVVGIGIGVALVVLFGLTFVVLRPR